MQLQELTDEINKARRSNKYIDARNKVRAITDPSPTVLSNDDAKRLLSHFATEYTVASTASNKKRALLRKALVEFAMATGLREEEIVNLRLKDLNLKKKTVNVVLGKGGKTAKTFFSQIEGLTDNATTWIQQYLDEVHLAPKNKDSFLFHAIGDAKKKRSTNWVYKATTSASEDLGIAKNRIAPHRFRHFYATSMQRAGVSPTVVQEGLRHARIATSSIYTHHIDADLILDKAGFVQMTDDGLLLGAGAGEGDQLKILEDAKKSLIKERNNLIKNQADFLINKETVRVSRVGADIFPVSVWPNLNMDIKTIDISTP